MGTTSCSCLCPECVAGSHADCTGDGEDCDFEIDDNDDELAKAAPDLDVFINTVDGVDHYFHITGTNPDGTYVTEEWTKEQYDAWVAQGEVSITTPDTKPSRAALLAKIMSMFSDK
jgi:hypothetical protein